MQRYTYLARPPPAFGTFFLLRIFFFRWILYPLLGRPHTPIFTRCTSTSTRKPIQTAPILSNLHLTLNINSHQQKPSTSKTTHQRHPIQSNPIRQIQPTHQTMPSKSQSTPIPNRRTMSDRPNHLHSPALSLSSTTSTSSRSPTSSTPTSPRTFYPSRSPTIGTVLSSIRTSTSRSRSPSTRRSPVTVTASPSRANSTPSGSGSGSGSASSSPTAPTHGRSLTLPLVMAQGCSGDGGRPRTKKRNSGTVMQVGRHSDEWLFGGFSFRETVRDLLSPGGSGGSEQGKN